MQRHWDDKVIQLLWKRAMVCRQRRQPFARAEPPLVLEVLDCFTEWLRRRAAGLIQRPRTRLAESWLMSHAAVTKMIWTETGYKWEAAAGAQWRFDVTDE